MTFLKKCIILAIVVAAGAAVIIFHRTEMKDTPPSMQPSNKTATLRIGATSILAEVADTADVRQKGLGGRSELKEGHGMWFVFETDGLWAFWMKDTLIPLDIIWASADETIVHIARDVQPESFPQSFAPEVPARYVLEVPAGYTKSKAIAEGDKIVVQ